MLEFVEVVDVRAKSRRKIDMYEVGEDTARKHNSSDVELHKTFVLNQHLCAPSLQGKCYYSTNGAGRIPSR